MVSQLCLMCKIIRRSCLGARPRYNLVVDEDVKKPNKQNPTSLIKRTPRKLFSPFRIGFLGKPRRGKNYSKKINFDLFSFLKEYYHYSKPGRGGGGGGGADLYISLTLNKYRNNLNKHSVLLEN